MLWKKRFASSPENIIVCSIDSEKTILDRKACDLSGSKKRVLSKKRGKENIQNEVNDRDIDWILCTHDLSR